MVFLSFGAFMILFRSIINTILKCDFNFRKTWAPVESAQAFKKLLWVVWKFNRVSDKCKCIGRQWGFIGKLYTLQTKCNSLQVFKRKNEIIAEIAFSVFFNTYRIWIKEYSGNGLRGIFIQYRMKMEDICLFRIFAYSLSFRLDCGIIQHRLSNLCLLGFVFSGEQCMLENLFNLHPLGVYIVCVSLL